jgi:DNA replication protein DnaC
MRPDLHALLEALKLRRIRDTVDDALKLAQRNKPGYSTFLHGLLQAELEDKRSRSLRNHLKKSGLGEFWTLETFPFHLQPCVNKRQIMELADLEFVSLGESILFIGPAGGGKSGLAKSLVVKALFSGKSANRISAQDLFEELGSSRADRSTRRLLKRLSRIDLLLIDEFGYVNSPQPAQVNDFFRLMDNRCNRKSTILTTNLEPEEWSKFLGNPTLTQALQSRLFQNCHTIRIDGPNVRDLRDRTLKLPARPPLPDILTQP